MENLARSDDKFHLREVRRMALEPRKSVRVASAVEKSRALPMFNPVSYLFTKAKRFNWPGKGDGRCTDQKQVRKKQKTGGTMKEDLQAVFDRDPAARSKLEVILTYSGLHAIWMHRIAHGLYKRKFFLLARIFTV